MRWQFWDKCCGKSKRYCEKHAVKSSKSVWMIRVTLKGQTYSRLSDSLWAIRYTLDYIIVTSRIIKICLGFQHSLEISTNIQATKSHGFERNALVLTLGKACSIGARRVSMEKFKGAVSAEWWDRGWFLKDWCTYGKLVNGESLELVGEVVLFRYSTLVIGIVEKTWVNWTSVCSSRQMDSLLDPAFHLIITLNRCFWKSYFGLPS